MSRAGRNLQDKLMGRMRRYGRGKRVYTAHDFQDLGSGSQINDALRRLANAGLIRRLDHGFYDYPRFNNLLRREGSPDIDLIAQAIARRAGVDLLPDGLFAANGLGLTNAVAARPTYVTNGRARRHTVGAASLEFKHATPKRMRWAHRPGALVVQALSWLGEAAVERDPTILDKLRDRLPLEVRQSLRDDAALAPARWMIRYLEALAVEEER